MSDATDAANGSVYFQTNKIYHTRPCIDIGARLYNPSALTIIQDCLIENNVLATAKLELYVPLLTVTLEINKYKYDPNSLHRDILKKLMRDLVDSTKNIQVSDFYLGGQMRVLDAQLALQVKPESPRSISKFRTATLNALRRSMREVRDVLPDRIRYKDDVPMLVGRGWKIMPQYDKDSMYVTLGLMTSGDPVLDSRLSTGVELWLKGYESYVDTHNRDPRMFQAELDGNAYEVMGHYCELNDAWTEYRRKQTAFEDIWQQRIVNMTVNDTSGRLSSFCSITTTTTPSGSAKKGGDDDEKEVAQIVLYISGVRWAITDANKLNMRSPSVVIAKSKKAQEDGFE